MKLNLKDEPREWRKSALLAALGLALISSLLRWRQILTTDRWLILLAVPALIALAATYRPCWFRSYHLLSMRLGFVISRFLGTIFLVLFFLFILTPVGWMLRLAGKDPLQLKRPQNATTYWHEARKSGPLDRLF